MIGKSNGEETSVANQLIEGVLYLLSKPVSLKELSSVTQIEVMEVEDVVKRLQKKYNQLKSPFMIEFNISEIPGKTRVELKLSEKAVKFLASYDFITTQELPALYYRYMSSILLLEYVKNKKIDKKLLEKELKMDKDVLEKKLRILLQSGFLKKTHNYFTTSERFLKKMGLPTEKNSVKEALKEKAIKYTLDQLGFEDEQH